MSSLPLGVFEEALTVFPQIKWLHVWMAATTGDIKWREVQRQQKAAMTLGNPSYLVLILKILYLYRIVFLFFKDFVLVFNEIWSAILLFHISSLQFPSSLPILPSLPIFPLLFSPGPFPQALVLSSSHLVLFLEHLIIPFRGGGWSTSRHQAVWMRGADLSRHRWG